MALTYFVRSDLTLHFQSMLLFGFTCMIWGTEDILFKLAVFLRQLFTEHPDNTGYGVLRLWFVSCVDYQS